MQAFLQAMLDDDFDAAEESLAPDLLARCDEVGLRFSPLSYQDTAQIVEVEVDGAVASLEVVFVEETGPFDESFQLVYAFVMEQIDGEWLIVDLDERFGCR